MGQKVHPYGLRLGIIRQCKSTWFAEGPRYRQQLVGDLKIRQYVAHYQDNAAISDVTIERTTDTVTVTIRTAKPGIVIGRGGRDVDMLRQRLEKLSGQKVRVNVEETKDPDTNAVLVAQNIARQIERRVSFRRAMRQAVERAMKAGAKGARCKVAGRLQGAEIARSESIGPEGRVPLHTLRADIEYGRAEARTGYGHIGVKVWIYKGEILPPKKISRPQAPPPVVETPLEEALAPEPKPEATPVAVAPEAVPAAVAPQAPSEEVTPVVAAPEAPPAAPDEGEAIAQC